jgi:hypothetical protein
MKKYYAAKQPNRFSSKHLYLTRSARLTSALFLIIASIFYGNYFKVNSQNASGLDSNTGYNKKIVINHVGKLVDNAVSANNWFAKYHQLQSTILKESRVAQVNVIDNNSVSLYESCQQLNNSLLVAKGTPMIPNLAAQESWRKAQIYYRSAVGLCSFPKILTLQAPSAFINNLRQGDKQLLISINFILNCC